MRTFIPRRRNDLEPTASQNLPFGYGVRRVSQATHCVASTGHTHDDAARSLLVSTLERGSGLNIDSFLSFTQFHSILEGVNSTSMVYRWDSNNISRADPKDRLIDVCLMILVFGRQNGILVETSQRTSLGNPTKFGILCRGPATEL